MRKEKNVKKCVLICALALATIGSIRCSNGLKFKEGQRNQAASGILREKSLIISQSKLDDLNACTFDSNCRNQEVCAVLDLVNGPATKCIETANICREASCGAGLCLPIGVAIGVVSFADSPSQNTTVTCVEGGDQAAGANGSYPGNVGDGTLNPSYELVTKDLTNLVSNANSFSFEAKVASSGEVIRVVINQPIGSLCQSEAVRATAGRLKLGIFGNWKALRLAGFSGNTYQFSQADYCYSGELNTILPEI
ncbi:MAG: hypothetical protein SGJ18_13790 [Pseudomonadota bacterium]|nr:hypothetical protein [Pseudomonadota bacterium]